MSINDATQIDSVLYIPDHVWILIFDIGDGSRLKKSEITVGAVILKYRGNVNIMYKS